MIKKIYITRTSVLFAIFIGLINVFGAVKIGSGYLTPDETYFLFGSDYEQIQYAITAQIMRFIYTINPMLLIAVNFILVLLVFKKKSIRISVSNIYRPVWLLLLPSVAFFCVVFLRDIYLFVAILMLSFTPTNMNIQKKIWYFSGPIIILLVFKSEMVILVFLAYLLSMLRIGKMGLFILCVFVFPITILAMFSNETIRMFIYFRAAVQEKTAFDGLMGMYFKYDYQSWIEFVVGSFKNFPLFHLPYLLNKPITVFDMLLKLDSIEVLVLLIVSIFVSSKQIRRDQNFRFCIWLLIISFAFSIIQTQPTSAIRYSLPFKPCIAYIAISGCIQFKTIVKKIITKALSDNNRLKNGILCAE